MIDSANSVLQGIVNQIEFTYTEADGTVIATENPEIEARTSSSPSAPCRTRRTPDSGRDDWFASLANGEFATMLCPGWMLGVISGNAPDTTGWDIADVFPNGGGNWGGSYLTVPANGANVDAALALADWLTAPEQQMKAFANAGTFPSQLEALDSDELAGATNEYFNDAPTGEILVEPCRGRHGRPVQGRELLQVPRRAPERGHASLRRSRRPADLVEHLGRRGRGLLGRTPHR